MILKNDNEGGNDLKKFFLLVIVFMLAACSNKGTAVDPTSVAVDADQEKKVTENEEVKGEEGQVTNEVKDEKIEVVKEPSILKATDTVKARSAVESEAVWTGSMTVGGKKIDVWVTNLATERNSGASRLGNDGDMIAEGNAHIYAAEAGSNDAYLYETIDISFVNLSNDSISIETFGKEPTLVISEWVVSTDYTTYLFPFRDGQITRLGDSFISTGRLKHIEPNLLQSVQWMTGYEFPAATYQVYDQKTGKLLYDHLTFEEPSTRYERWHSEDDFTYPVRSITFDNAWLDALFKEKRWLKSQYGYKIGDSMDELVQKMGNKSVVQAELHGAPTFVADDGLDLVGDGIIIGLATDSSIVTQSFEEIQTLISNYTGETWTFYEEDMMSPPSYSLDYQGSSISMHYNQQTGGWRLYFIPYE